MEIFYKGRGTDLLGVLESTGSVQNKNKLV
jgi:hypothetical protein